MILSCIIESVEREKKDLEDYFLCEQGAIEYDVNIMVWYHSFPSFFLVYSCLKLVS